mgnify:CR=1 FL=1
MGDIVSGRSQTTGGDHEVRPGGQGVPGGSAGHEGVPGGEHGAVAAELDDVVHGDPGRAQEFLDARGTPLLTRVTPANVRDERPLTENVHLAFPASEDSSCFTSRPLRLPVNHTMPSGATTRLCGWVPASIS